MFDAYLGPYEGHWHVLRNGISKLRLVKGCVIIGKGEHEVIGEKNMFIEARDNVYECEATGQYTSLME